MGAPGRIFMKDGRSDGVLNGCFRRKTVDRLNAARMILPRQIQNSHTTHPLRNTIKISGDAQNTICARKADSMWR